MLDQYVYHFDNAASGRVLWISPSTYMATTGWDSCDVGQSPVTVAWGAFFSFDTSNLPDHADVTLVQFRVRRQGDPIGEPDDYEIRFAIGDIIGGSLDGNVGEWTAGTDVLTLYAKPADKTTLDLDSAACALVDKSGDTDIRIRDYSTQGGGSASWSTNFNYNVDTHCHLYVFFTVPSATATAVFSASCSATVTHAASASATAVFSAELAAALIHSTAGATASAVFTASMAGGLEVPPLAQHSATISVSTKDTDSIAIGAVDSATISIEDEDSGELGPRRNV